MKKSEMMLLYIMTICLPRSTVLLKKSLTGYSSIFIRYYEYLFLTIELITNETLNTDPKLSMQMYFLSFQCLWIVFSSE